MRRLVIITAVLAFCAVLAGTATSADAAPDVPAAPAVEAKALGHSHQHTDCLLWAQVYINSLGGGTINEWPWFLDGWRDPFLFYGDTHTQCSLVNVYYGVRVVTWSLLNIDHTPVDAGTHDWAIVPVGSF